MTEVEADLVEGRALSPYSKDVLGIQMADMIRAVALKQYETGEMDANGHMVTTTLAEQAIAARLMYMKDHPESFRLDELTRAMDTQNRFAQTQKEPREEAKEFFSSLDMGEGKDDGGGE